MARTLRSEDADRFFHGCATRAVRQTDGGPATPFTNCWEFRECGREPGGCRVAELGVCSIAACTAAHGLHHGTNGGRVCWAIPGGCCTGTADLSVEEKIRMCVTCEFFKLVQEQETTLSIHDIRDLAAPLTPPGTGTP